ncbi:alpha/beta hydrolase family protein [Dermatobacter hominis]|uniref:alpha/beta hydrolase family protein n=1 Tax=Dermatobacter hominis TaxID=2884263 RepID=UPI001D115484|nr:alpha/beta family hydrolase [Dermatobacter hominis]UDY37162.1 dienelactone hydrolase [Dermatobacter hominis]
MALWPGAGSASDQPGLVAIDEGVAPLPVARIDFPYRREGRRAPDRAPKLMASVRDEVAALCERWGTTSEHLVLGGRSMGGRICSMVAAGAADLDPLPVAGLVLMSYPLHPPGKPENLRTAHLPDLRVPVLFVSGDRDAFGTPDELAEAQALIPGPVTSVTLAGKGHDLKRADPDVVAAIRDWLGPRNLPA